MICIFKVLQVVYRLKLMYFEYKKSLIRIFKSIVKIQNLLMDLTIVKCIVNCVHRGTNNAFVEPQGKQYFDVHITSLSG